MDAAGEARLAVNQAYKQYGAEGGDTSVMKLAVARRNVKDPEKVARRVIEQESAVAGMSGYGIQTDMFKDLGIPDRDRTPVEDKVWRRGFDFACDENNVTCAPPPDESLPHIWTEGFNAGKENYRQLQIALGSIQPDVALAAQRAAISDDEFARQEPVGSA